MPSSRTITPASVTSWIKTAYDKGPDDTKRSTWTAYLHRTLTRRARTQGLRAWATGNGGEYLVDHCWARRIPARGDAYWSKYDGLSFAAEFEWGGSVEAMWEDFIRLLDVRADARLFAGALWSRLWPEVDVLIGKFEAMVGRHRHTRPGDWVIVAMSPKGARIDEADRYWQIDKTGSGRARSHRV